MLKKSANGHRAWAWRPGSSNHWPWFHRTPKELGTAV